LPKSPELPKLAIENQNQIPALNRVSPYFSGIEELGTPFFPMSSAPWFLCHHSAPWFIMLVLL
jgi:hypothetical protein